MSYFFLSFLNQIFMLQIVEDSEDRLLEKEVEELLRVIAECLDDEEEQSIE